MSRNSFLGNVGPACLSFSKVGHDLWIEYDGAQLTPPRTFTVNMTPAGEVNVRDTLKSDNGAAYEVTAQQAHDATLTKPFYDLFTIYGAIDGEFHSGGVLPPHAIGALVEALSALNKQLPKPVVIDASPVPEGTRLSSPEQPGREHIEIDKGADGTIHIYRISSMPFFRQEVRFSIKPSDHISSISSFR